MVEYDASPNQKPQVNISRSTQARMWLVCFCAVLAVVQSSLSDSGVSLIIALTVLASGFLAELLITYQTSSFEKLKDGSTAASALILALMLPNKIHPVYALFGIIFSIAVVKYSFGGLGSNWLNPSLGGWLFIRFSWPGVFKAALEGDEFIANPIGEAFGSFLNRTIFSLLGVELPSGYAELLFHRGPGIIADRGLLALLLGTVIIFAFRLSRSWIPAAYLGVFSLLVLAFGEFGGEYWKGDLLMALFSGGTILAAFILVSDPATGAKSWVGILACALLSGFLAWLFRYGGSEMYGAFFAIGLVNAITPMVRFIERRFLYSNVLSKRGIA
jgi:electron transport complex protein RnfD